MVDKKVDQKAHVLAALKVSCKAVWRDVMLGDLMVFLLGDLMDIWKVDLWVALMVVLMAGQSVFEKAVLMAYARDMLMAE